MITRLQGYAIKKITGALNEGTGIVYCLSLSLRLKAKFKLKGIILNFDLEFLCWLVVMLISQQPCSKVVMARVRRVRLAQGQARQTKSNKENRYVIKVMKLNVEQGRR